MKTGKTVLQLLLAVVMTLSIIGVSVVVTLGFRSLYYHDIKALDIPGYSGYPEEEIRLNYDVLIDYNMTFKDGVLEFPTLAMSEAGRIHFEEVKEIFDLFKYFALFGSILSVVGIIWFVRQREYRFLKYTGIVTFSLPAVLGILVAVCWDQVFVGFHKLFFNNDFWIFDYRTDPVILILPDEFFMHCAIMIFAGVMLGALICTVLYLVLKKRWGAGKTE